MDWSLFIDLFTNADRFLTTLATEYGILIYVVMFLIFFMETGIVIMAFLPGDSLLFVAGAVTASGAIDPWILTAVVTLGAITGNTSNFYIGRKTIFLARFVPVVRSFAPLIAGAASMPVARFELYSISGAFVWVYGLIWAGHLFGNIPFIRNHLTTILLCGICSALVPTAILATIRFFKRRSEAKTTAP